MEALKELFNKAYYEHLANEITKHHKQFKAAEFVKSSAQQIKDLSLNERMRFTSTQLHAFLNSDFEKNVELFKQVIKNTKGGYTNLVFPDYVSQFGLQHVDVSLEALKYFTQFGSSEFAIRVFLKQNFQKTLTEMEKWSRDKNVHVRRLASEGSRPRLPWSFKITEIIEKPQLTKQLLENLKADEELYVRKSVANHLNDISKENPDYMINLINTWDKNNKHTAWIIKHASRSLIKKGHPASLQVFDFEKKPKLKLVGFKIQATKIKLGQSLIFEFSLKSEKNKTQKLVVDYVIHYKKKSGDLSPKVFKLKEIELKPNQKVLIQKSQVIKDFTTRKHFAGKHVLEIQINGIKMNSGTFTIEI